MKTQIVYTIISSEQDYYLEQLIMSVFSLKIYNSQAEIIIVTDKQTSDSFVGWRSRIKEMVSGIEIISIPDGFNNMQASRFLKTNLRRFIKGDYLFIDTDTIICGKLDTIDKIDGDIALVSDCNSNLNLSDLAIINRCEQAGFYDMEYCPYYNSGVMFVRDTSIAYRFYDEWYKQWLCSAENDVYLDQPSMNFTNKKLGNVIKELSGEWNCQIFFKGWDYLPKAKIMHYAGGGKKNNLMVLYKMIRELNCESKYIKNLFCHPKVRLYAYLTNIQANKKAMFMLYLHVYLNMFSNLFFVFYKRK